MDLSFSNKLIRDYFEGNSEDAPIREALYVHEHPLISPNFLVQLDAYVQSMGQYLVKNNIKTGYHLTRIEEIAIEMGSLLPDFTEVNAAKFLAIARELYQFCKTITGKDIEI